MGHIGRFSPAEPILFPRGARVICRTQRGLEIGEVVAPVMRDAAPDGTLLRGATPQDELIAARLQRYRDEAFQACAELLQQHELAVRLIDVEHLFDGQSLYFYFLGEATMALDAITAQLAGLYTAKVQFERFHDALTSGCGPGCGTESASNGCGTSGCASCAVSSACRTKRSA
jgi:cell fate regulator YaaT (PSP1 superfamily)